MRVRRRPVVDEYTEGGESAVFVDDNVVVLSELATTMLGLVGTGWTPVQAVADGLVAAFGPPPPGRSSLEVTRAAVDSLVAEGVLETTDAD